MFRARTIKESLAVSAALEEAATKYSRTEEWWEGWKWRLARDPCIDAFPLPETDPQKYLIKTYALEGYNGPPSSTLLYTFDADVVEILWIKIP